MIRQHLILAFVVVVSGCGGSSRSSAILHIECNRHGGKTNQQLQLFESGWTFFTSSSYPIHERGAGRLSTAKWKEVCENFQQILNATDLPQHDDHGSVTLSLHVFFADARYMYVRVPTTLALGNGRYSFIEDYYEEFHQRARSTAADEDKGVP